MKSYTGLRNLFGSLTNNTASTNLTLGDELINDSIRVICASHDWDFLQKSGTASTVGSTQFYNLPYDLDRLVSVKVTIGSTTYVPKPIASRAEWDRLNSSTSVTSNIPEYFYIFNGQLGFYPTPSSSTSNAITYIYRRRIIDLAVADYTTGNVSAITNGATAVTGSGTSWTAPMGGRWLKVTQTDTAGQSGDGLWYEISSIGSSTTLTLSKAYNGTTISGNTAYTIGQISLLPESYQDLPLYRALFLYFSSVQPEVQRATMYKQMFEEGMLRMKRDYGSKTMDPVISERNSIITNPNLVINTTSN